MIGIIIYSSIHFIHFQPKKKYILSFQQQTDSNFGKHLPYVLSEDFLCETPGAGQHVTEWKILNRNKMIT